MSHCCFTPGRADSSLIVSQTINQVRPVEELRWITFGHLEADECGAMNLFGRGSARAGRARRRVRAQHRRSRRPGAAALDNGDVIDTGAHRLRYLATPHVPHAWDAGVYYDESTGTLPCGDLFTAVGQSLALVNSELVGPAMVAEDMFAATCLTPQTAVTMCRPSWRRPPWR